MTGFLYKALSRAAYYQTETGMGSKNGAYPRVDLAFLSLRHPAGLDGLTCAGVGVTGVNKAASRRRTNNLSPCLLEMRASL
jgi:hypothetical protein